jgi:methylated-DNA-[protein]-cysteine S-methyltransferase
LFAEVAELNCRYFRTPFGDGCFVWGKETVYRVFLPFPGESAELKMRRKFGSVDRDDSTFADEVAMRLAVLSAGASVDISLQVLDFGSTSPFCRKVLLTLMEVERGTTVSYGELAGKAGFPGAARAVGGVLASNPFPLIIPCHRVVRSDGTPGSYQGGTAMKKYLLEAEIE